jgi:Lrp/AsnC family leucine-responsive transcriptional regulator
MPICFILITTATGHEKKVYNNLSKLPEIVESHIVSGECDIIAKLKVDNLESLPNFVANKIRSIEGVKDARTLTGLELK